jgi:hypothetical protein
VTGDHEFVRPGAHIRGVMINIIHALLTVIEQGNVNRSR